MKKQFGKKLNLSRETLRSLVSEELQKADGGIPGTCGAETACDCSGPGGNAGTLYCTLIQR